MSFQYLLYLKLDSSEENVFWYSHIFIIFEAQISYLEHKGGYRNVIHIFNSQFDRVSINIDFSEKLEIPLKKHPVCPLGRCWFKSIPVSWKRVATKSINVIVLIQGNAFSKLVLDEIMLEDINHDHEELKNLKEVFL